MRKHRNESHTVEEKMRYYSLKCPIILGNYPNSQFNSILKLVNFKTKIYCTEIQREAYGYIDYKLPLSKDDEVSYELMPASQIYNITFIGVDSFGRLVYEDESGMLWKYTEPGKMPIERHDTLHKSSNNELEGEPGWPMSSEKDYRIEG